MNNKTKENEKEEKEQSIKIQFLNEICSIKYNRKNKITSLKKHLKDKFKLNDEQINNYYFYLLLLDNTEIKVDNDIIFSKYVFEHNFIFFIFKEEKNEKQIICSCDKKYNEFEEKYNEFKEKYNELKKKYNDISNREIKNENLLKEQESRINQLFKDLEGIKKKEKEKEKDKEKKEEEKKFFNKAQTITANNNINFEITSVNKNKEEKNENEKNIPYEEKINAPSKEKKEKKNIITNPGIHCEILFNEKDMPMILKSQINKIINLDLQIKNIGSLDLPKNCKFMIRNGTSNINIINPELNIIKIGEISNVKLNLKFIDLENIKIGNNDIELCIHSDSFGLLSNFIQLYILVKDDSQNILVKE